MRLLKPGEVKFWMVVEEEDMSVRGNLIDSGDKELDKRYEDEVIEKLSHGDVWAWAWVQVFARWAGFEGSDSLGGCSYSTLGEFCQPEGYYPSMVESAVKDLVRHIRDAGWEIDCPSGSIDAAIDLGLRQARNNVKYPWD